MATLLPRPRHAACSLVAGALLLACGSDRPPPPAPSSAPAPAPAAAPAPAPTAAAPRDAGGDVKLGLVERVNRLMAQRREEAALAAKLAEEEKQRLMKYDRARLAKHKAVLAFVMKTRKQLDDAAAKAAGDPKAAAQIEKVQIAQRKPIMAQAKVVGTIDPKGGNSNIVTDHEMSLQLLAEDYPQAIAASLSGDGKPLEETRAELDRRQKKIEDYLAEIAAAKK